MAGEWDVINQTAARQPAAWDVVAQNAPEPDHAMANASLAKSVAGAMGQTVADIGSVYAPIETALNVATGLLFGFPAYLGAGVGTLIARGLGLSDDDPKEIAKKYSELVTYKPYSEAGRRLTETTLLPLTTLMEASEVAGKKVADVTGSPGAAALTEATIQMLPAPLIGSLGRRLAGKTPTVNEFDTAAWILSKFPDWTVRDAIEAKLRGIYEKTGIDTQAIIEASEKDPTIIQDLASENITVPKALAGKEEPRQPPPTIEPVVEPVLERIAEQRLADLAEHTPSAKELSFSGLEPKDAVDVAMIARASEIDSSAVERLAARHEGDDAGFMLGIKEVLDEHDKARTADRGGEKGGETPQVPGQGKAKTEGEAAEPDFSVAGGRGAGGEPPQPTREPPIGAMPSGPGAREGGGVVSSTLRPRADIPRTEAEQKVLSRIVTDDTTPRRTIMETLHHWYTEYVDRLHPIMQAQREGGIKKGELGPYELERLTAGVAGKAKQFIEFGTFDPLTYETTGRSYKSVLDMVADDPKGFEAYIVAKHAIEREAAGKATGIEVGAARQVIADGAAKFEAAAAARVAYKDALLDYVQKSGLISVEAVAAMREAYKAHVPFNRFFEGEERAVSGKEPRSPIKRAKGSERLIIDPIKSDIMDTFLFISLAEKNMARQALVKQLPQFVERQKPTIIPTRLQEPEIRKMFDEFLTTVKKTSKKRTETKTETEGGVTIQENKIVKANAERVKEALTARGFSDAEADTMIKRVMMGGAKEGTKIVESIVREIEKTEYVPEINIRVPSEVATIFRAIRTPTGPDEIAVMQEGKRVLYKTDPELARAYAGLDAGAASMLSSMLRTTASWLRAGVTLSPDFSLRNVVRDAVSAFVYAGSHPLKTLRGAIAYWQKSEPYQNWLKGGGANAAMVSMDRRYIEQHLYEMEPETHLMGRAWNIVKSPFEVLRIVGETLENVTRLGISVDELTQAKIKAQIQALSMLTREGTVDFSRHGADPFFYSWTRATAFMNPALQGIDRMVRAFKDNPVGTTAKAFASITIPSVLLWWRNHEDPRWKDVPDWERDLFWIVFTDNWEPPDNENQLVEKNALGLAKEINGQMMVNNGHTYRIPKSFELGVLFGSLPERILDAYVKDNKDAFKNFAKTLLNVFGFNIVPTVLLPPLQQATNFSLFTDRPVIPDSMKKLLPEYQYFPYTTEATKAMGHIIGSFPGMHDSNFASPIMIDNYIRGWSGTLGPYVVQLADLALRKTGVLPDPMMPTKALAELPVIKAFTIRYPAATAQSVQDFYDQYEKTEKVAQTVRRLAIMGDVETAIKEMQIGQEDLLKLTAIHSALGNATRFIQLIYRNPQLDADEKRQLIDSAYAQMILQAQMGNQIMRAYQQAVKATRGSKETVQ